MTIVSRVVFCALILLSAARTSGAADPASATLSDGEYLARAANGWGNRATAVTAAEVAKLRKTTDPTSDRVIILKMR